MQKTFGQYLRQRREALGLSQNQLCSLLFNADETEFGKLNESAISRWENDGCGLPKIARLKKLFTALGDDPSSVISTLHFPSSSNGPTAVREYLQRIILGSTYGNVIGSYIVNTGHYLHDMSLQFSEPYARSLLDVEYSFMPGQHFHPSLQRLREWAATPGVIFQINVHNQSYNSHLLIFRLKPAACMEICSGQRSEVSICNADIAAPGEPFYSYLYSFYACNPAIAANLLEIYFNTAISSEGRCLKLAGNAMADGLTLAQAFGARITGVQLADPQTIKPFYWNNQKLALAQFLIDTIELYARLGPSVIAAMQSNLTPHPRELMPPVIWEGESDAVTVV